MFAFTSYLKKHNYSNQIFRQTGYVHSYICCVDFIWFRVKIFHVCFLIFHDKPSLYLSNISCCQNKHCKFDWLTTSLFISFLAFDFLLIDHSIWSNDVNIDKLGKCGEIIIHIKYINMYIWKILLQYMYAGWKSK